MHTSSHTKQFNEFLTTQLNNEQRAAATHINGPLLVVAGAGSGKTRVITTRIAHLILNEGVSGRSIIALTFTNKAAREMKERIAHFLGDHEQVPFVGTFHSYCLRLLKQYASLLPIPFISILDQDDQLKIIQGIIARNGLQKKVTAKQISYQISQLKNQTMEPTEHEQYQINPLLRDIYHAYESEKQMSRCYDFDDLLIQTVKLFNSNAAFRHQFQERHRHVLIDEYQDTNVIQHELLKAIALKPDNSLALDSLCAVGDEDQSIYSWRGATVANIINFKHDFKKTTVIKIEQNYRSVKPILACANEVISNNKNRNPKNLWSEKPAHDRVRILTCMNEYQEADAIAQCIRASQKTQKRSDSAILYRAHYQSRAIEEALIKQGTPYTIIGGIQFYERKEIKDLLAYLRLLINPYDRPSFFRVINCPLRGLGQKFEEHFQEIWTHQPLMTFQDVAHTLIENKEITGLKKDAVTLFLSLFKTITTDMRPSVALSKIIEHTEFFTHLKSMYEKEDAESRIDNVKELKRAIDHLEANGIHTINQFLDEVALIQSHNDPNNEDTDHVLMMTLHAAKGLEFNTIIIAGIEEGIMPNGRSMDDTLMIEEERRLFYVGMTRAQERLLLTHCRYRNTYGTTNTQYASRFLEEVPSAFASGYDGSYWSTTQHYSFFSQWFGSQEKTNVMTFGPALKTAHKEVTATKHEATSGSGFKKHQPVTHSTFGLGIIQKVEEKPDGKIFLTINFKHEVKKIDARFVQLT